MNCPELVEKFSQIAEAKGLVRSLPGGHGVVCIGEEPEDAIGILEAAENYAKTLFIRSHMI